MRIGVYVDTVEVVDGTHSERVSGLRFAVERSDRRDGARALVNRKGRRAVVGLVEQKVADLTE